MRTLARLLGNRYLCWGILHYYTLMQWCTGSGDWGTVVALGLTIWFWSGDIMHSGAVFSAPLLTLLAPFNLISYYGGVSDRRCVLPYNS